MFILLTFLLLFSWEQLLITLLGSLDFVNYVYTTSSFDIDLMKTFKLQCTFVVGRTNGLSSLKWRLTRRANSGRLLCLFLLGRGGGGLDL